MHMCTSQEQRIGVLVFGTELFFQSPAIISSLHLITLLLYLVADWT